MQQVINVMLLHLRSSEYSMQVYKRDQLLLLLFITFADIKAES